MTDLTPADRIAHLEATCDRLAAALILVLHDAHPTHPSTAGRRGGIGGQMFTPSCSLIDPPLGDLWTQLDLPSGPARDWVRECERRGRPLDLEAVKVDLVAEWTEMLG